MMDVSDCIAMSEDGDWYAFPASAKRSEVISAIAAEATDWWDVLHAFSVSKGHVYEASEHDPTGLPAGWWFECEHDYPGAVGAWIARRR